jgi:hypothetical protein
MDLLRYFGDFLAEKIGKDPIYVRGLLRIAIREYFHGKIPQTLDFSTLHKVIDGILRKHLEKLNISNTSDIIQDLLNALIRHQSLFTLGQVY